MKPTYFDHTNKSNRQKPLDSTNFKCLIENNKKFSPIQPPLSSNRNIQNQPYLSKLDTKSSNNSKFNNGGNMTCQLNQTHNLYNEKSTQRKSFLINSNKNDLVSRDKHSFHFQPNYEQLQKRANSRNMFQSQVCSPQSTHNDLSDILSQKQKNPLSCVRQSINAKSSQNTPRSVLPQSLVSKFIPSASKFEGTGGIHLRQKPNKIVKNPDYFSISKSNHYNPLAQSASQITSPNHLTQQLMKLKEQKKAITQSTKKPKGNLGTRFKKNRHSKSMTVNDIVVVQTSKFRLFNNDVPYQKKEEGEKEEEPILNNNELVEEDDDEIDQFFADTSFTNTNEIITEINSGDDEDELDEGMGRVDEDVKVETVKKSQPKATDPLTLVRQKTTGVTTGSIQLKIDLQSMRQKDSEKLKMKNANEKKQYFYQSQKFQNPIAKSYVTSPKQLNLNNEYSTSVQTFQFSPQSSYVNSGQPNIQLGSDTAKKNHLNLPSPDKLALGKQMSQQVVKTEKKKQPKNNNNNKSKILAKKKSIDHEQTLKFLDKGIPQFAQTLEPVINNFLEQKRTYLYGMKPKRKIQYEVEEKTAEQDKDGECVIGQSLSINIHKAPSITSNQSEQQIDKQTNDSQSHLTKSPSFIYSVETCSKNLESSRAEIKESFNNQSSQGGIHQKFLEITGIYTSESQTQQADSQTQKNCIEIEDIMLNGVAELQEKLMIFDNPKAEMSKPTIDSVVSHTSLLNGVMIYDGTSVDIDDYE